MLSVLCIYYAVGKTELGTCPSPGLAEPSERPLGMNLHDVLFFFSFFYKSQLRTFGSKGCAQPGTSHLAVHGGSGDPLARAFPSFFCRPLTEMPNRRFPLILFR